MLPCQHANNNAIEFHVYFGNCSICSVTQSTQILITAAIALLVRIWWYNLMNMQIWPILMLWLWLSCALLLSCDLLCFDKQTLAKWFIFSHMFELLLDICHSYGITKIHNYNMYSDIFFFFFMVTACLWVVVLVLKNIHCFCCLLHLFNSFCLLLTCFLRSCFVE